MPTIQQSLTEPNTGADHKRLNEFLAFLATHLAAPDYATAVILPTAPSTPPSPPAATARPRDEQVARRLEEAFQNARRSNGGYGPRRVFARPRRAQPNPGHCPRLGQPHQQENTSDTPRRTIDGRPSKAFPRRPRRGPAPPRDGSERARPAVRRRAGRRRRRAAPAVRAAQRRGQGELRRGNRPDGHHPSATDAGFSARGRPHAMDARSPIGSFAQRFPHAAKIGNGFG